MSRPVRKAQVTPIDLFLIALVFFMGVGLFLFMNFMSSKDMIISKQTIYSTMELDDRGSELVAAMASTYQGTPFMVHAGATAVQGYNDHISDALEALSELRKSLGTGYALRLPGIRLDSGEDESGPDAVPIPSGCFITDTISQSTKLIWPMPGVNDVSSQPGLRQLSGSECRCHKGVDIPGGGLDVIAAYSGTVSRAYESTSYGNTVIINHNGEWSGYSTLYAHLDSISVSEGDRVSAGQKIGISGNTGISHGSHLHFEVIRGSIVTDPNVDPCRYLQSRPSSCVVMDRCELAEDLEPVSGKSHMMDVPLPGAREGSLKGRVELVMGDSGGSL